MGRIAWTFAAAAALAACGQQGDGSTPAADAGGGAFPSSTVGSAAPAAPDTATLGAGPSGQDVYGKTCFACHAAGVAGAPKLGDKADWGPRIAQGKNVLYQHAVQGFTGKKGVMPPKGGNTALADADVHAAVDYMVSQVK